MGGKFLKVGRDLLGTRIVVELLHKELALVDQGIGIGLVLDIQEGLTTIDKTLSIGVNALGGHIVGFTDCLGQETRYIVHILVQLWVNMGLGPHVLDVTNHRVQTITLCPALQDNLELDDGGFDVGVYFFRNQKKNSLSFV